MPKHIYDWKAIQEYHDEGHGFVKKENEIRGSRRSWRSSTRT